MDDLRKSKMNTESDELFETKIAAVTELNRMIYKLTGKSDFLARCMFAFAGIILTSILALFKISREPVLSIFG